jgi:hypothetical protein
VATKPSDAGLVGGAVLGLVGGAILGAVMTVVALISIV